MLLTKYINDLSSLTGQEREIVEALLLKIENEANADSANRLMEKIDMAQGVLDMLVQNPQLVTEENIAMLIDLVVQMGYTPDLNQTEAFLSEKKTELQSQIAEIENGQALLHEALDGIEQYQSGAIQLHEAKVQLENASDEIQKGAKELDNAKQNLNEAKKERVDGKKKHAESEKK